LGLRRHGNSGQSDGDELGAFHRKWLSNEVHPGTGAHAEAAVRAAQRAFETTKKSAGCERKRILNTISERLLFSAFKELEMGA
jgi:acyl-CoA reductase-like NAD-dependent aldehyde dehydrogenase